MFFLYKHGKAVNTTIEDISEIIPAEYYSETLSGEYLRLSGKDRAIESSTFSQKKGKLDETIREVLSQPGCLIMSLDTEQDDQTALTHTGLHIAGETGVAILGSYMKSVKDQLYKLPDFWGRWPGIIRLLDNKLYSNDGLLVMDDRADKVHLLGNIYFSEKGGFYYRNYKYAGSTASYGTTTHYPPYCPVCRESLTAGQVYYEIPICFATGKDFPGTSNKNLPRICDKCLQGLKKIKTKKLLRHVV